MSTPSSPSRTPGRGRGPAALAPLLAGGLVVAAGALVGSVNDWSTGALWGVAVAATVVAGVVFAVPAVLRAPSIRATTPARGEEYARVSIGARVGEAAGDEHAAERVLVLSGHSRSGKSTIAERLIARQPGWTRASCGEYVRAQARELGIEPTLPNTHALGQRLVEQMGGEGFLQAVLDHARIPSEAHSLIVDDVYHVAVFEALRGRWPSVRFTSVDLPESIRRSLLREQGLDDEQVERIEDSPLDHAVEQLEREYPPERRLTGAARPADADTALREIGELLAAA